MDQLLKFEVVLVQLCYWAAVMFHWHNYPHQSKIAWGLVTTKHFTGLIGALLTKCIWSQSSPLLFILLNGIYGFVLLLLKCVVSVRCVLMLGCVCVCIPAGLTATEATQAEATWVAWLSEDGDETGQLYSSGARCSIRLDLNIALESRSCLRVPPRLCGTPARSSFLILGNALQICSLGWPNSSPVVRVRLRFTPAFYLCRIILN